MSEPSFATFHRPLTGDSSIVNLTSRAATELKGIIEREAPSREESGLRLRVVGGGCSGLSYEMKVDTRREHDHVQEEGGVRVIVDPKSAIYLKGTTLDFQDGLNGRGFVFTNPNARNTCGCGESFSA